MEYLDVKQIIRTIPMDFDGEKLAGKYFLVTGSGKYFKNVEEAPAVNLGVIQVSEDGKQFICCGDTQTADCQRVNFQRIL